MNWSENAIIVLILAILGGWVLWLSASRLDRLHRKVMASRLALEAQLVRRASAAVELAASGLLDPASAVLVTGAAYTVIEDDARDLVEAVPELNGLTPPAPSDRLLGEVAPDRAQAESELSATLRSALGDAENSVAPGDNPLGRDALRALAGAWFRAQLARRFHNEAVAQAQRIRRKWYVRAFHLAGRAPMPTTVEFDDAWPSALGRPSTAGDSAGRRPG